MNSDILRIPLSPSPYNDPVYELSSVANAVQLSPADFPDWDAMFSAHPDALDYLLTPGDYRSWGRLQRQDLSIPGGTAERRRTIRYFDPTDDNTVHPVRRIDNNEVIIDDSDIWAGSHVIFHGLTFRPTANTQTTVALRPGATDITIDQCLFENYFTSGVTIYGSRNTLQRSVMRDAKITAGRDTYGVMTTLQQGNENVGSRVIDCEVYNHVDQIAATVSSQPGTALDELRDCVVDGNDFYNTREYIDVGDSMENLLDYKTGTNSPRKNLITNNRFWGLAASGGGSGGSNHSIVFHRAARGWVVADNIIGENTSADAAIFESVWHLDDVPFQDLYRERRINYCKNIIYQHSRALGVSLDGYAISNTLIDCKHLLFRAPDGGRKCPTPAEVIDTRMTAVDTIEDPDTTFPLETYRHHNNTVAPPVSIQYQRKRWTGPEWVTVHS